MNVNQTKKTRAWYGVLLLAAAVLCLNHLLGLGGLFRARAEQFTAGSAVISSPVKNLDIEWTSGRVSIAYHDENTVTIEEKSSARLSEDQKMQWRLEGDTLRIQYEKKGLHLFSLLHPQKELTVTLPQNTELGDVNIHATAGSLNIPELRADRLSISVTSGEINAAVKAGKVSCEATSGNIDLKNIESADDVSVKTTSGNINLEVEQAEKISVSATSGSIRTAVEKAANCRLHSTSGDIQSVFDAVEAAEIQCTSGKVDAVLAKMEALSIETTSGSVMAALPASPGFTVHIHTSSGRVAYELPLTKQDDIYACGDGSGQVILRTASGNITVTGYQD